MTSYLVETDWLADHLDDPTVVVLDVTAKLTRDLVNRAGDEVVAAGHIPGAVFFDVPAGHGVLSDPDAELPWMWPDVDRLRSVLAEHGVGPSTRVILTASTPRPGLDAGTMWCTRAWWTLHHSGLDVAILRGGNERWQAEGRPMAEGPATADPVADGPTLVDGRPVARATKDDVMAALADGRTCVVDALPEESYRGEADGYGARKGHITGARNLPFRRLIDDETAGFPADRDEIERRLETAGLLAHDGPIVTYCGGAIAATVPAFCLALVGRTDVRVYDGSLMEWSADPSLPMTDPAA